MKTIIKFSRQGGGAPPYLIGWDAAPDPVFLSLFRDILCHLRNGKTKTETYWKTDLSLKYQNINSVFSFFKDQNRYKNQKTKVLKTNYCKKYLPPKQSI